MAKVSTNITIDADTKKQAQILLADFGMDLSTAVNIFLKQMIRDRTFPFTIKRDKPNAETLAAMDAVESGKDVYGPFDSVDMLMNSLNEENKH